MYKIVLIRHGESTWNLENRFTGWTDVDLTPTGEAQARQAGRLLKAEGYEFDTAFTSLLRRAIRTLWLTLEEMEREWLPVTKSWRLNERHYGALQGLNKAETAKKYGDDQVLAWRRSYDVPPPALALDDPRYEGSDLRYANMPPEHPPLTECLKDTVARVVPYWQEVMAPAILSGKRIVVAAHGNSIRALIKYLDEVTTWVTPKRQPKRRRPWPAKARLEAGRSGGEIRAMGLRSASSLPHWQPGCILV